MEIGAMKHYIGIGLVAVLFVYLVVRIGNAYSVPVVTPIAHTISGQA